MSAQPVSFPVPHQPAFFSQKTLTWCTTACFPSDHSSHQPLKLDYKVLSFASNPVCPLPFVLWIHRGILSPGAGSPWIAVSALFLDMPAHILTEILRHRARHPFSSSPCCCFSLVSLKFYRRAHIHSCSPPVTSHGHPALSQPARLLSPCSCPLEQLCEEAEEQQVMLLTRKSNHILPCYIIFWSYTMTPNPAGFHMTSIWHKQFP